MLISKMIGIYKIYGLKLIDSDMISYIGLTKQTLKRRLNGHKSQSKRRNLPISNWIKKYYNEIEIVLIEDNINNIEEACEKEKQYIKLFKSFGSKLKNISIGGFDKMYDLNGNKLIKKSDEWKARMSLIMKGNKNSLNRKLSDNHKQAIIDSNKRRKITDETRKKMSESAKKRYKKC